MKLRPLFRLVLEINSFVLKKKKITNRGLNGLSVIEGGLFFAKNYILSPQPHLLGLK